MSGRNVKGAFAGDDFDRLIAAEGDVGVRAGAASAPGAIHPGAAEKDLPGSKRRSLLLKSGPPKTGTLPARMSVFC